MVVVVNVVVKGTRNVGRIVFRTNDWPPQGWWLVGRSGVVVKTKALQLHDDDDFDDDFDDDGKRRIEHPTVATTPKRMNEIRPRGGSREDASSKFIQIVWKEELQDAVLLL